MDVHTDGIELKDVAQEVGLSHIYRSGTSGKLLMVEGTGGGVGWIDYDRDGHWDLYLTQGGDPALPPSPAQPSDRLFRNDAGQQFVDVTGPSLAVEHGYTQGVAIGDFDNDGFDDIYVTNVGANVLFHNCGDGTFQDVSASGGVESPQWSSSAAWADIDRDGDLDLYVCNYVDFDRFHPRICQNASGLHVMCQPNQIEPVPDECFLNRGDGTFEPSAQKLGLFGPGNRALGVAIADFDNDDWPDIFVANDATANFLFLNDRAAHFKEAASVSGCAVSADGSAQANMGVAVGDYDRNGWLDLYVTHFEGEWNTLYRNLGAANFEDVTASAGLVQPTMRMVGWGTVMTDLDHDGTDELFVANGHLVDVGREAVLKMEGQLFSYRRPRWIDISQRAGSYFERRLVGRGVAECDWDNDGDWDLAVVHQDSEMALLRNDSTRGHWLKVELTGRASNRRGIGSRVTVTSGDRTIVQEMIGGGSYCSARQPALLFGLGERAGSCDVTIRWSCGTVQKLHHIGCDRSLVVLELNGSEAQ
ncbi:MAG: CRTAC1 family protein [Planctomycetota bacterium]